MTSTIGKNIQYLRKKNKLSQSALAETLGMSRGNIASYEGGKAKPDAEKLLRLCEYFKVDISDMIHKDLSETTFGELSALNGSDRDVLSDHASFLNKVSRILDGYREYHKLRLPDHSYLPPECQHLVQDYDRLSELFAMVLERNTDLVEHLRNSPSLKSAG